jgi:hypothetical protein
LPTTKRTVGHILDRLDAGNRDAAIALARWPEGARLRTGQEKSVAAATAKRAELQAAFDRAEVDAGRGLRRKRADGFSAAAAVGKHESLGQA